MKNIHLLPTDKPSRFYEYKGKFGTIYSPNPKITLESTWRELKRDSPKHKALKIYITSSNEEIKEGDWCICLENIFKNEIFKVDSDTPNKSSNVTLEFAKKYLTKIILTTDQDLIKDGVQAIDEDFLEWFVKNPSCEYIDTKKVANGVANHKLTYEYKIIIPTEELEHRWVGALVDENIEDIYEPYRCETKDLYTGNDCLPSFETKEECQAWCDSNNKKVEIKKETHNYLQGFINQFEEGGEHQEISNNDWTVSSFLQWLQLNNFKIIKIDNKE